MIKRKIFSLFKLNLSYRLAYLTLLTILCLVIILTTPIFLGIKTQSITGKNYNSPVTQGIKGNAALGNSNTSAKNEFDEKVKGETATAGDNIVFVGMWTQGFLDGSFVLHPEKLKSLENQIGKKVAIAHYYRGWEELEKSILLGELNLISQNGWRPMISVNPYFFSRCPSNGLDLYKAIASGNCDEFLHSIGRNLSRFEKPFFLRFAWEMNINSIEWSVSRVGSTSGDFVLAWRRFHDILEQENVGNVLWVWSPNEGGSLNLRDLYPGDNYVDWLALDGYNWGTTQPWSSWRTFSQVFSRSYAESLSISPEKPLMLAEVNSTNIGGDKAGWYLDMLEVQIPNNFPKIKAVVFYNEDRSSNENVNWLIGITSESLAAFKRGISKVFYSSNF